MPTPPAAQGSGGHSPGVDAQGSGDLSPSVDPQRRIRSLDGLRGWAALIVVVNHVFNASLPGYLPSGEPNAPAGSLRWWVGQTPLHLIWAGPEMVIVFFVLSGYVLTLPAVARGAGWFSAGYYPRRFVRLYLPAWGALLFALAMHYLPARTVMPGANAWLDTFAVPVTAGHLVETFSLLGSTTALNAFTSVLWSMKWEVAFSLLLPLVVWVTLRTRGRAAIALAVAAACTFLTCHFAGNGTIHGAVRYLPIFVLGSLMAVHLQPGRVTPDRERAEVGAGRSARFRHPGRGGPAVVSGGSAGVSAVVSAVVSALLVVACAVLLTTGYWTVNQDVGSADGWPVLGILAGACLAVGLAVANRLVVRAMSAQISQWLGRRSYSLYLIHQPIVISLAFAWGGHVNTLLLLVVSVPLALIATELCWRLVERPAITLSRRVQTLR